jgi:Phage-related minor tail protein
VADREAKVRIGGDISGLNAALGRAKGNLKTWSRDVKTEVGGALRGAFQGLSTIAGFTGIGGIALAIRETKLFNDRLVALQQTTGMTRGQILGMNQALQATAVATGIQQTDLLAGIEKFQEVTGEAGKFTSALGDMANVSTATNAKMADIAATAAAASQNLGVTSGELLKMFDILAVQGDRGAVELKDMATMMPQLAAAASRFATQGVKGVAEWGAVMQVVRRGTGSSAEALTQTVDLSGELLTRWRELEHAGVSVFSDKAHTQAKDFLTIVDEISRVIPRAELSKVMGLRKEALFAYDAIVKYRKELASFATTADKTGAIVKKNDVYMASSTAQFNLALASIHKTANDLMMGALPGLASAFQMVASSLKWIGDHKDIAIAAFAAWKLAPSALSGLGSKGGASGALGGLAGTGGATPVFVTNLGAGGMGGAGMGGVAGAATAAQGGLAKLNRGLDAASKILFAFGIGYAAGGLIADAAGLNSTGTSMDAADYKKYGQFSADMERDRVHRALFGEEAGEFGGKFQGPMGEALYDAATRAKGSAAKFHPEATGLGDESEADFVKRTRHLIDVKSAPDAIMTKLSDLVAVLRERLPGAIEKVTEVHIDGEKVATAVAKGKGRRRAP